MFIYGSGRTPVSWTTRSDVARFTAHHLASLTSLPAVGAPSILRIEGTRASFLDVVDTFRALHPSRKVEFEHLPLEEGERAAKDVAGGFVPSLLAYLRVVWEKGQGMVDQDGRAQLSNGLWPEWNPKTVEEVLKEQTAEL